MFPSVVHSSSAPKTVLYSLQQGHCGQYRREIYSRSNIFRSSNRNPSIITHNFSNNTPPALRRDTNLVKYKRLATKPDNDTVPILDSDDRPVSLRDDVVGEYSDDRPVSLRDDVVREYSDDRPVSLRDDVVREYSDDRPISLRDDIIKEYSDDRLISLRDDVVKKFSSFYKFCRPYAILGSVICISSFSIYPLERMSDVSLGFLMELLKVIVCVVLINIHLIGVNQVCDLPIDKINKPDLPLASGEMSLTTANVIIAITGFLSIGMALLMRSPPFLCVILSYFFFLGVAYSLDYPFLRWKKNAFLAVFCIIVPKGFVIPICMSMHIQKYLLRKPIVFTRTFAFSTTLALIFIIVTALFKDVPDLDGDKAFGMKNFTILFGKEKIFSFCTYLMMLGYGAAVIKGATLALLPMKLVTGIFGTLWKLLRCSLKFSTAIHPQADGQTEVVVTGMSPLPTNLPSLPSTTPNSPSAEEFAEKW